MAKGGVGEVGGLCHNGIYLISPPPPPASALCSISMIPLISHQSSVFPLPPLILYKRRLIPLNNNYSLR